MDLGPSPGQNTVMVGFLIWDFDGTLGYREGLWSSALLTVLESEIQDREFDVNLIRAELGTGFPWHTPGIPHPELSSPDLWWASLTPVFIRAFEKAGLDLKRSETLAHRVREAYIDPRHWRLFNDTIPALKLLSSHGWTHVILSNHVPELTQIIAALGLSSHIRQIFNSAESGYEKPHPLAFEGLLEELDHPKRIWMIGDSPAVDVRGAEAAGIPAILVRGRPGGAERHREDLSGIEEIVDKA